MNQKSQTSMDEMAEAMMEIANRTKVMSWLERSFEKVGKDGSECRALLAVALLKKECDKESVAEFLKVTPHTAYTYLQQLEKKGILEGKSRWRGQLVYFPKFTDGIKIGRKKKGEP